MIASIYPPNILSIIGTYTGKSNKMFIDLVPKKQFIDDVVKLLDHDHRFITNDLFSSLYDVSGGGEKSLVEFEYLSNEQVTSILKVLNKRQLSALEAYIRLWGGKEVIKNMDDFKEEYNFN